MPEPLERSMRVRCSIEHAFEVFTGRIDLWWPRGHRRFEDSELRLEPVAGGRFLERSTNGDEFKMGEVLSCKPPHRISYMWYPGAIKQPTRVDIRFAEDGAETVVSVLHSEAGALGDAWPERVKLFERGWQIVLSAFSDYASAQNGESAHGSLREN